jgi:hypothetical protein
MNKCLYFVEGLKKLLCTKSITLKQYIKSLSVVSGVDTFEKMDSKELEKEEKFMKKDLIFKNKSEFSQTDTENEDEIFRKKSHYLKKKHQLLLKEIR